MFKQSTKQVGIIAGFGLALFILAAIAGLSYKISGAFIATSAKVSHTHEVIAQIESLNAQLLRAESGQRSFIISGDETYLAPYKAAVQSVGQELQELRTLIADNPAQRNRVDDLQGLISNRLQRLEEGVVIRRRQSLEGVADFIKRGSGKGLMDSISTIFTEMKNEEGRLLQQRSADTAASARLAMAATLVGSLIAFLLIAGSGFIVRRDLNKRQQTEAIMRASEARLSGILDIADDAVISIDDDHQITLFNQGAERIFSYKADEIIGQPLNRLLPARFTATHYQHIAEMAASSVTSRKMGERRNIFGRRKDGSEFPAEASISKLELDGERVFTVMLRDVTDHKRAEEILRASEARLAGILNIADDAVISIDDDHRITMFNQGAERIFGYKADEVIGQPLDRLLPSRFAQTHQQHINEMAASSVTSRQMGERRNIFGRRKDGSEFPAEASISKLELDGERVFTVMLRDITSRRQVEEEINQLNASLERRMNELELANKELESFSYSVSHDLRAPLRAIDGFSRILLEDYADKFDAEGNRVLNVIRSNTVKMSQLINDLLEFSRLSRRSLDDSIISLEDLANSAFNDLRAANPERALKLSVRPLPRVRGDRAMLRQVFVNLLTNAVKFTRTREVGEIDLGSRIEDGQTVYYVRDNGVGFDMKYIDKLFGVFQRLHSNNEYEGTGVGLAIVQRIVHRHGGRVWAEGKLGQGATFYFTLQGKEMADEQHG